MESAVALPTSGRGRKWGIRVVLVLAVLGLAPVVVPFFSPWSAINCRYQDINIRTGQTRSGRMLWFFSVSEKVEDTFLSEVLAGEAVVVTPREPWRRVNTLPCRGGGWSPHHNFHGALAQIIRLEDVAAMGDYTIERQREVARGLLAAWQTSGRDSGGDTYIRSLMGESREPE